jgi:hypothetical protein
MEIFLLAALMYWMAAPDRLTAAARTAAGTGLKAGATGAKVHWAAGRPGRQATRTDRRDRWWKADGWRRKALKVEHAAVWTCDAGKTVGGVVAAAARPIPAAVRDGWRQGQDRHRARAAGKPAGLALDPPWWRPPVPAPVPQDSPEDSPGDSGTFAEDSPEPAAPTPPEEQAQPPAPARITFFPDAPDGPVLDDEADIRARNPDLDRIQPEPLTEGQRRFWHLRDRGYPGALDQDGWPAPDFHTGAIVNPMPYLRQPAGASPETAKTPTSTNGAPMPAPTELRTHVAVQDFAQQIDQISEASDFIVVAEKARTIGEQSRAGGFGAEMDSAVDSLEETARQFAQAVDSMREQARRYAQTSMSVQGS